VRDLILVEEEVAEFIELMNSDMYRSPMLLEGWF
jgi:hypothetical protein